MIIVWGSKMYGRVDGVPGMFYVATKFGHLWYLPLIPCGSYLIFEHQGKPVGALRIKFSFKSFLMAWLRTFMVILAVSGLCWVIVELLDKRMRPSSLIAACAMFTVMSLILAYITYGKPFLRASYLKALKISEEARFPDEHQIMLEACFGNISEEEAQSLIETAREVQAEEPAQAVLQVQDG